MHANFGDSHQGLTVFEKLADPVCEDHKNIAVVKEQAFQLCTSFEVSFLSSLGFGIKLVVY